MHFCIRPKFSSKSGLPIKAGMSYLWPGHGGDGELAGDESCETLVGVLEKFSAMVSDDGAVLADSISATAA